MNKLDKQYTDLLQHILDTGIIKKDRTGTGTKSVFGYQIRHDMKDGFPLLTTKKMPFKTILVELLWFLRGETNIKFLIDNGCHVWDGDCYKYYEKAFNEGKASGLTPMVKGVADEIIDKDLFIEMIKYREKFGSEQFANEWGEMGPIYGKQWRSWTNFVVKPGIVNLPNGLNNQNYWDIDNPIDQIKNAINLLKTDPDSRRNMVNAWNVGELRDMKLPPCHYGFQFYTRELSLDEKMELMIKKHNMILEGGDDTLPTRAISLMWNQRSVDTFLGLPFNIASYGLLLSIVGKLVNMVPDQLIGNLGDTHLYLNHLDEATEQIGRQLSYKERLEMLMKQVGPLGLNHDHIEDEVIESTPLRTREPFALPRLELNSEKWGDFLNSIQDETFCKALLTEDIQLKNYLSHPKIAAPLSN